MKSLAIDGAGTLRAEFVSLERSGGISALGVRDTPFGKEFEFTDWSGRRHLLDESQAHAFLAGWKSARANVLHHRYK
jgi:hypothetical protein